MASKDVHLHPQYTDEKDVHFSPPVSAPTFIDKSGGIEGDGSAFAHKQLELAKSESLESEAVLSGTGTTDEGQEIAKTGGLESEAVLSGTKVVITVQPVPVPGEWTFAPRYKVRRSYAKKGTITTIPALSGRRTVLGPPRAGTLIGTVSVSGSVDVETNGPIYRVKRRKQSEDELLLLGVL